MCLCIGNKNSMDHLVKVTSVWCNENCQVESYILDVDQTGPTTMDGVEAIQHSLKKVGCSGKNTDRFKIRSITTDSGGAMTREGLGDRLKEKNLATPDMLVGTCGAHNTQLQLSNPVLQFLGAGELGKKNLMQLLHSVYALQSSMPIEEWWQVVDMSVSDTKFFVEEGSPEATMANQWEDYVKFLREKERKKMGNNYTRLDMNKWNDEFHFDRKIGTIMSYKNW
jgi:hypothetical protein